MEAVEGAASGRDPLVLRRLGSGVQTDDAGLVFGHGDGVEAGLGANRGRNWKVNDHSPLLGQHPHISRQRVDPVVADDDVSDPAEILTEENRQFFSVWSSGPFELRLAEPFREPDAGHLKSARHGDEVKEAEAAVGDRLLEVYRLRSGEH